jgi:hypothetical protein
MAEGELRHFRQEYVSAEGIIGQTGSNTKGKKWYNHMSASEIRQKIGDPIWNTYFKFCVIRNPFDKCVSGFYFFESQKRNHSTITLWKDRLKKLYPECPKANPDRSNSVERFRNWVRKGGSMIDRDKYVIDEKICIDYFIRFEDLQGGIKHVCSILDIPFEPERIPKLKSGIRNSGIPLYEYYDAETIEIVRNLFTFELQTFGYSEPMGVASLQRNEVHGLVRGASTFNTQRVDHVYRDPHEAGVRNSEARSRGTQASQTSASKVS